MKSLKALLSAVATILPAAHTSDVTGATVDLANFASNKVNLNVGTITDGTHTPKLQESVDDSTWTDVAAADQDGTLAALVSDTAQSVGYIGTKRYIRVFVTVATATTGGVYAAEVERGNSRVTP